MADARPFPDKIYPAIFMAAAIYNFVWGAVAVLAPDAIFRLLNIPAPTDTALWQCIGMMVGVYALGYWLAARDPRRYGAFILIGLLGKVFGPLGFLMAAIQGDLPWRFGWVCLTNDLIWWIPFGLFLITWRREELAAGPQART